MRKTSLELSWFMLINTQCCDKISSVCMASIKNTCKNLLQGMKIIWRKMWMRFFDILQYLFVMSEMNERKMLLWFLELKPLKHFYAEIKKNFHDFRNGIFIFWYWIISKKEIFSSSWRHKCNASAKFGFLTDLDAHFF